MNRPRATRIAQSVQVRLKKRAMESGRTFAELVEIYAVQRFLHRLGRSKHRDHFVLKGATLLYHWLNVDPRPTRDIDLMGPSDLDIERAGAFLRDLLSLEVEDDGIEFDLDSVSVRPIRPESPVLGLRAKFNGYLGRSLLRYQVDVGLGDAVFPPPDTITLKALLDFPMAAIKAYTPYTAVAEKLESMVILGGANSRMKDYYDLAVLSDTLSFDGSTLAEAIRVTFERRSTRIPEGNPVGLSAAFAEDPVNSVRWDAFVKKWDMKEADLELSTVVRRIRLFLLPVLRSARSITALHKHWPPGGPWQARKGGKG